MQETILPREASAPIDRVEKVLQNISQNIIVFVFGLLPLFFIPVAFMSFDYVKTIAVIVGVLLAVIFFSLSVLRSGKVQIAAPLALGALWLVAIATTISAMLSGDMRDAFLGDDMGVHTALFVVLLALVATITSVTGQTKMTIMRLYILLTGSAIVLALFHIIRLVVGTGVLSFGMFTSLVATPIGGWNDLGLFFGLSILLSLVALEQLPLTKWGKGLFTAVVVLSLVMLAVVNFFAVWVVLGLVSLAVLMYTLTKDRFEEKTLTLEGKKSSISVQSVILSVSVFIVSLVFVIGGGTVGGAISKITNVSYLEVRPSFSATTDIARNVYRENAFVGIGPNKFTDAWRMYKDPSINETLFWSTDFKGGSGYLTTLFVTTGILGTVAWLLFFVLFLFAGFKMLFKSVHADRFWYFIGSSSFVGATYLWGMSAIYVPGSAILLLAAMFTSITFASYSALVSTRTLSFSIAANKRAGFALVGVVMVIIVGATSGLYYAGQNYASVYTFGSALSGLQKGMDIKQAEEQIASAYTSSQNELYALQLASYQLAKINALVAVPKLSTQQTQELQISIRNGINAGQIAVNQDPTDSLNWSTLGSIYSILAGAGIEGAKDKAQESFDKARTLDPKNPLYPLLQAQLVSRVQDLAGARTHVMEAIALKPNYTDALFFLTQIDIIEGKTDDAIATTNAIISLEPNNPARYYQLGVLLAASQKQDDAIVAFRQAVALDVNYANARYFLAIALGQKGDNKGAIEQLQKVLELNPGNEQVNNLITQLQSGKPLVVDGQNTEGQVAEPQTVTETENGVTTTEKPETPLVTPVNTVNDQEQKPAADAS
jgi:cytochrome c-type biogenesis protein CcmH/NrfG